MQTICRLYNCLTVSKWDNMLGVSFVIMCHHVAHMAADVHRQLNIEAMILRTRTMGLRLPVPHEVYELCSTLCLKPPLAPPRAPPRSPKAWCWHFSSVRLRGGVFHLSRAVTAALDEGDGSEVTADRVW